MRLIYLLVALLCLSILHGQEVTTGYPLPVSIRILKEKLPGQTGSEKLESLINLSESHRKLRLYSESDAYAGDAFDFADTLNLKGENVGELHLLGRTYFINKLYQKAGEQFREAIALAKDDNRFRNAYLYYYLGLVNYHLGNQYRAGMKYGEMKLDSLSREVWMERFTNHLYEAIINLKKAGDLLTLAAIKGHIPAAEISEFRVDQYEALARCYFSINEFHQALDTYLEALQIFEKENDIKNQVYILYRIADFHRSSLHDPENAVAYSLKAVQLYDRIASTEPDLEQISLWEKNYAVLGFSYFSMGNYHEALKYYQLLFKVNKSIYGEKGVADYHNYIGRAYLALKQFDSASIHFERALDLSSLIQNKPALAQSYYNFGKLYFEEEDYATSLQHHLKALEIRNAIGRNISVYQSLNRIAEIYQRMHDFQNAIQYLKNAAIIASELHEGQLMMESAELIAVFYASRNAFADAYAYYTKFKSISDSVAEIKRSNALIQLQVKNEMKLKENEIIKAKEAEIKKHKQRTYFIGFFGASVVLLMVLTFVIFYQRYKARLGRDLILSRQDALRSQMNPHFIFNSLSSIQNFVLKNHYEIANEYLTSFSNLIRQVLENSKSNFVPLSHEIKALKTYLHLEQFRFENKFNVKYEIEEELLDSGMKIPPIIIQPVVENAIIHGLVPKKGRGQLQIIINKKDVQILEVIIIDDGIGRQAAEEIREKGAGYRSIGLENLKERLRLLGRQLKLDCHFQIADRRDHENKPNGTLVKYEVPYIIEF